MILEKMKSFFSKLELAFWTYGLIHILDPIDPNVVSRPQTQTQNIFSDFIILLDSSHDSWENEVLFLKIEDGVLDLWLDTSSGPRWTKRSF